MSARIVETVIRRISFYLPKAIFSGKLMGTFSIRLVIVVVVICSLSILGISISSFSSVPSIRLARAVAAPCPTMSSVNVCSEYWTPAGAGMETLTTPIFTGGVAEYTGFFGGSIDLTDVPDANAPFDCAAASYYYTAPAPWGQFCYLSGWHGVVNKENVGIPNYFTWLDAWNPSAAVTGTIRQGFSATTRSVNPYVASTVHDMYILRSVYDSLHIVNPLNSAEDLSWMDVSLLPQSALTYTPPAGTVLSYRFTLMPNLNWQDGKPVASFDVAFSYLSLLASGAYQSSGASALSGVTILGPTQFDLNLNSVGPFTRIAVTGLTIIPGRYWTCGTSSQPSSGSAPNIVPGPCPSTALSQWDSSIAACTSVGNTCYPVQYALGTAPLQSACYPNAPLPCAPPTVAALNGSASFVANLMSVDVTKTTAQYDPIQGHIFIGSGPWTCGTGAGLGQACTPGNVQNPAVGQSYTLRRNGSGITPGFPGDYFRSSGFLATWLWSGDIAPGINNFSVAASCYNHTPLDPLSANPPASACGRFEQGIGTNGATTPAGTGGCPAGGAPCGIPVGAIQVSIVRLYINIDWVFPDFWNSPSPPIGVVPLDPVLYAGSAGTLSPAIGAGGVGCASAYPTGGYDC